MSFSWQRKISAFLRINYCDHKCIMGPLGSPAASRRRNGREDAALCASAVPGPKQRCPYIFTSSSLSAGQWMKEYDSKKGKYNFYYINLLKINLKTSKSHGERLFTLAESIITDLFNVPHWIQCVLFVQKLSCKFFQAISSLEIEM